MSWGHQCPRRRSPRWPRRKSRRASAARSTPPAPSISKSCRTARSTGAGRFASPARKSAWRSVCSPRCRWRKRASVAASSARACVEPPAAWMIRSCTTLRVDLHHQAKGVHVNTKTASIVGVAGILAMVMGVAHADSGRLRIDARPSGQPADANCDSTYVADCGFESGAPNTPGWVSTSTNYGNAFCSTASCGSAGGPMVPHSGTWFAWFGGNTSSEVGSVSQVVELPSGQSATLSFWYVSGSGGCTAGPDTAYLEARIDGEVLWHTDAAAAGYCDGTYAQITVNIPESYLGGTHSLEFHSEKPSTKVVVNMGIDDVSINVTTPVSLQSFSID